MSIAKLIFEMIEREGANSVLGKFSERALANGVAAYIDIAGPQDGTPPDGHAFCCGHALGEIAALRRAKVALSDPRTRGIEAAVVGLLADGFDTEDAIRKAGASPEINVHETGRNVIAFPRQR